MSTLQAIFLGLLQGITEFLPISSSGHLILAESFFGLKVEGLKDFDIVLHLGTLLAILLYFRKDLFKFKDYPFLIVGSLPAIFIGLLAGDWLDAHFRSPASVVFFLVAIGLLFFLPLRKDQQKLDFKKALLVGLAQSTALIPGVSRSGATILTGNQLGLSQVEAARFSFLLGAIAIAGAGTLELVHFHGFTVTPQILGAGFATAFGSSLVSVSVLMRYLSKNSLRVFGVYRLLVGAAFLLTLFF